MQNAQKTQSPPLRSRTIHLVLQADESMGREILRGFEAYGGRRLDWHCRLINLKDFRLGQAVGPPEADAVVGFIVPGMVEHWDAEQRRTVINIACAHEFADIASVTSDDRAVGRMAAKHLRAKKLHSFAYSGRSCGREEAFAARVREWHAAYETFYHEGEEEQGLREWLARLPVHTGILAHSDKEAQRLLWIASEMQRMVPQELAVIGVDADYVQSLLSPVPVTSVDPDFYEVGYRAGELLDRIFDGYDARDTRIRVPPKGVVERASTDFPAIDDPEVVMAARFIRENACNGARVLDVLKAVPLSRRPLERRFRAAFGRSMLEEIHRTRVTEAARLLAETNTRIHDIAVQTGFGSNQRLTRIFGKLTGQSPAAYRRTHRSKKRRACLEVHGAAPRAIPPASGPRRLPS